MNENKEGENRGQHIKPSARISIHSHCISCSSHSTMGRYGTNVCIRARKQKPSTAEEGVDEVDNVISKMAAPISPLTRRKNTNPNRRNSTDGINYEYSEEESDDAYLLSKSSPASFLYYSDEYSSAIQSQIQNISNESTHSNASQRRLNNSLNHSSPSTHQKCANKRFYHIVGLLVIIFGVLVYYSTATDLLKYFNKSVAVNKVYDKFSFINELVNLEEKYNVRGNLILQVRTGVATIFENQDTGSFIFTYNSKNNNFNTLEFNRFMEDLAAAASRYLRNGREEAHVVVDPSKLLMQSVKEFMDYYEEGVDRTGVMLVKDIDHIPSDLAMAFHYYCDEFNPLVKKSAIFFTLNLANCYQHSDQKSTHAYIEKCLTNKWSSVGEEKISPLLARVVNVVVDVSGTF